MSEHVHPVLSAYPFVLLSVAALGETAGLLFPGRRPDSAVKWAVVGAAVGTVAAFLSGYWAASGASRTFRVDPDVIAYHHSAGRLLLMILVPCVALFFVSEAGPRGAPYFRAAYLLLLVTCLVLSASVGYLGGELVFTHGAGVSAGRGDVPE